MCSWKSFETMSKLLIVRVLGRANGSFKPLNFYTVVVAIKADDVKPAVLIAIAAMRLQKK
jgi:hypothetical protein